MREKLAHQIPLQIKLDSLLLLRQTQLDLPDRPHLVHHLAEPPHFYRLGVLSHQTEQHRMRRHVAHARGGEGPVKGHLEGMDMRGERGG
jgi:hypothetical protein